jgi:hypothetical protein
VELPVDVAELLERGGGDAGECGDLLALLGGPLGRVLGDRRLDHLAHLEQLADERLAVVAGEVHVGQLLGHHRAVAAALDVAGDHEPLDRLAHRGAGDTELLAQDALGGQRHAGGELTALDRVGEALADLGRDRAAGDRVEAGGAHERPTVAKWAALGVEVERVDDRRVLGVAPVFGRHEPHHLELEAVGVVGVEALVGAVVALARRARRRRAGFSRISASSASVGTSHARWYIPTVRGRPPTGRRPAPMVKNAMSWWLSDDGARMNTNAPVGVLDHRARSRARRRRSAGCGASRTYSTAWFIRVIGIGITLVSFVDRSGSGGSCSASVRTLVGLMV